VHAFVVGAVPARHETVHLVDAFPLTALGKVDKRRLRKRVLVVQLPLP
jgi:non-ribosomal peptide synthetase component E (peptide arylation enzyme)